jgi:hypothetical protein
VDSVQLSASERVLDGLRDMLCAAIGPHEYVHRHVEAPIALLIIEAAKRAEDRQEWFPHGRWATIQAMQERTERELRKMFGGAHV